MGRLSTVCKLSPEQTVTMNAIIRAAHFADLDGMLARLAEAGIKFSRSALHRHVMSLKARELLTPPAPTLVVVIDTATGASATVPLSVSPRVVLAMLRESGLQEPLQPA